MSIMSPTLYPELDELRRTLRQFQMQYATEKPRLNELAGRLLPQARGWQFIDIEAKAASPLGGGIPEELAYALEQAEYAARTISMSIRLPVQVEQMMLGTAIDSLLSAVTESISFIAGETLGKGVLLDSADYGATQIELRHVYERLSELLVMLVNMLFEVFDIIPDTIEPNSPVSNLFEILSQSMRPLCQRPDQGALVASLSHWLDRWANRPDFSLHLQVWFEVVRVDLLPARNIDNYRAGDLVTKLVVYVGRVAEVAVSRGRLPVGMRLTAEGHIEVFAPVKLLPGYFEGLVLKGLTDRGIRFEVGLPDLVIGHDVEAGYVVAQAKPLSDYESGEVLAYPEDVDGNIVEAQVLSGDFPTGVRFSTVNGQFSVYDISKLKDGRYVMEVMTVDATGGITTHPVALVFGGGGGGGGRVVTLEIVLDPITSMPVDGDVIAMLRPEGQMLVSAMASGKGMPPGIGLGTANGSLFVTSASALTNATYQFTITGMGANGTSYIMNVVLQVNIGSGIDQYTFTLEDLQLPMGNGDVIGTIMAGSMGLRDCMLWSGAIPAGISMDAYGVLTVTDADLLSPGAFTFVIRGNLTAAHTVEVLVDLFFLEEEGGGEPEGGPVEYLLSYSFVLPVDIDQVVGPLGFGAASVESVEVLLSSAAGLGINASHQIAVADPTEVVWESATMHIRVVETSGTSQAYWVNFVTVDVPSFSPPEDLVQFDFDDVVLPATAETAYMGRVNVEGVYFMTHSIIGGGVQDGVSFDASGHMEVTNSMEVAAGEHAFLINALGDDEEYYDIQVNTRFLAPNPHPGTEMAGYVSSVLDLSMYDDGDIMDTLGYEGLPFDNISVVMGTVPDGISIDSTGEVNLVTEADVVAGIHGLLIQADWNGLVSKYFLVRFEIIAEEEGGGGEPEGGPVEYLLSYSFVLPVGVGQVVGPLGYSAAAVESVEVLLSNAAGLEINSTHQIAVADPTEVVWETATMHIRVIDATGIAQVFWVNFTTVDIPSFSPPEGLLQFDFDDVVLPTTAETAYMGRVDAEGVHFMTHSIIGGGVQDGVSFDASGHMEVTNSMEVAMGDHAFLINALGDDEEYYDIQVNTTFVAPNPHPGTEVAGYVPSVLDLSMYDNGDVMDTLSYEGLPFDNIAVMVGAVPSGISIDSTGEVNLVTEADVVAGIYGLLIQADWNGLVAKHFLVRFEIMGA